MSGSATSGGSGSLDTAPERVRKAEAWLADHESKPLRKVGLIAALLLPLLGVLTVVFSATGGLPVAFGVGTLFFALTAMGVAVFAMHRAWGRTHAHATALVNRYRDLQELGLTEEVTPGPAGAEASAIDRLVERIGALAGSEHAALAEAARAAAERSARMQTELGHLDEAMTGDPEADSALDTAREHIVAELARTRARVAEAYGALVELDASRDSATEDLQASVARVTAELEVDRVGAARVRGARGQAVG